jgi:hypothetical protein
MIEFTGVDSSQISAGIIILNVKKSVGLVNVQDLQHYCVADTKKN